MKRRYERMRFIVALASFMVLLGAALILSLLSGSVWISPGDFLKYLSGEEIEEMIAAIIVKSRLPRTLLALFAGAGLAVCGAMLQSVLKNPLADPFTLGVASGGALGAAIVILTGANTAAVGLSILNLASMGGSVVTMLALLLVAGKIGLGSGSIILVGISINIIVTSGILLLQYMSDISQSHLIVRWLMGELDVWGMAQVIPVIAVASCGILGAVLLSGRINHLMVGETLAEVRGIDVRWLLRTSVALAALMTGAIVAVCGPVAFVGLIVPHVVRFFVGYDNRFVIPLSAAAGGTGLLICDSLARVIVAPAEVPVGVITSILGGSTLVALLLFRRQSMGL